ncbi:MAG: purine-nucleoside phosphorylase [Lachnospiraceae bacterium]|jgi:purine-nucleoside phosphorylase|nr:purine-nucleoside phosphorylase [Lachnospiraceae bacterium]
MQYESNQEEKCLEWIRMKTALIPKVAVVLGSGLGCFAQELQIETTISYREIPGFPESTVEGHEGAFLFGYLDKIPVVCMKGRVHYYEGYSMKEVLLPIRLLGLLGANTILLTNAAGGVNPSFHPGQLMMIKDHIACFVPNPLVGIHDEIYGPRFPDMTHIYDKSMRQTAAQIAQELGIALAEGVYTQLSGPSYETPAEIALLRQLGCDAVGMSTAVEAIGARHMGLKVCGISCISNMAAGMSDNILNHEEVQQMANLVSHHFCLLVTELIKRTILTESIKGEAL